MLSSNLVFDKPKFGFKILYLFFVISIPLLLIKTYTSFKTVGLLKCDEACTIELEMAYDTLDILDQNPEVEYLNKKYAIKDISRSEPYLSNNVPVVDVVMTTDYISDSNVIEFKFVYKKQRIIRKIIEWMKE